MSQLNKLMLYLLSKQKLVIIFIMFGFWVIMGSWKLNLKEYYDMDFVSSKFKLEIYGEFYNVIDMMFSICMIYYFMMVMLKLMWVKKNSSILLNMWWKFSFMMAHMLLLSAMWFMLNIYVMANSQMNLEDWEKTGGIIMSMGDMKLHKLMTPDDKLLYLNSTWMPELTDKNYSYMKLLLVDKVNVDTYADFKNSLSKLKQDMILNNEHNINWDKWDSMMCLSLLMSVLVVSVVFNYSPGSGPGPEGDFVPAGVCLC